MLAHSQSLQDAARSYAALGWWLFPCKPRSKEPATPHGFKDATLDPAQVRQWWSNNPANNIGLACGRSGLAVTDVDPRNGGADSLAAVEREHGSFPHTMTSLTGAGGQHYLYRAREGGKLPSKLTPGIDLKADGGYVIAPPSIHPNGQLYRWDAGAHPNDTPLAELPAWILDLAQSPRGGNANYPPPWQAKVSKGERNKAIYIEAHKLREAGMPLDTALDIMQARVKQHYAQGEMTWAEAKATVVSAYRKGSASGSPAHRWRTRLPWPRSGPVRPLNELVAGKGDN